MLDTIIALCFFDLAKAFDTVWHRGLLAKLHLVFGVSGPALSWLESYLSSRSQFVSVLSINSDPLPVSSGVPQGSILGPLLFVAYVNDLPSIDPGVSLFADDTTLLSVAVLHLLSPLPPYHLVSHLLSYT